MQPDGGATRIDNSSLEQIIDSLKDKVSPLPSPYPKYVVFVSSTDGKQRARVSTVSADNLDALTEKLNSEPLQKKFTERYLRLDWVTSVKQMKFSDYTSALSAVKRNYSRKGLAFDPMFQHAVTEAEINASGLLYNGGKVNHCAVNLNNFQIFWKRRFGQTFQSPAAAEMIYLFDSEGLFYDREKQSLHQLLSSGLNTGRRAFDMNDVDQIEDLIRNGADYLAGEVDEKGRFNYGWFPCFDRAINHYNTLRHSSSTYALCEAYSFLKTDSLRDAVERSLHYIETENIVRPQGSDGPAYLVDVGDEIKLGGNAVTILAICKYAEATGRTQYLPLAKQLGEGILSMARDDGGFNHVLHASTLKLKEQRRTVYYDGEAAFALMRLHQATGDVKWLDAVRQALKTYIVNDYWQYNDHWLAYCTSELARYDPDPAYFRFGVQNVKDYLGFIAERITTFPTLLELCCATRLLIRQALSDPSLSQTLDGLDLHGFVDAMEKRAQYLANGVFFPEVAMHFRNPERITGSFFIRHHGFRVRIDDVEHYLSGLIAYRAYLDERNAFVELINTHNKAAELQA
ncbi:hypothetical protein WNY59_02530 [Ahrensia kielensis]|uniref:Uncharacterized protein n=1 Tax=Ahrensia kielensis TaxID=76980 RepID=A0ABU9T2U8_9HYPH